MSSKGQLATAVVLEGLEKWTEEIELAETLKDKIQKVTFRVHGSHILVVEISYDGSDGDSKSLELEFITIGVGC